MLVMSFKSLSSITAFCLFASIISNCTPTRNAGSQGSWSGLSDILEINHFDADWQDEVQSGNKEVEQTQIVSTHPQTDSNSKEEPKRKRIRDNEKFKVYRQNYKNRIKSNPLAQQLFRMRKNESNKRWEAKKVSKLSESEKEAFFIRKQQIKKEYNKSYKLKYGGHSCPKRQRIGEIRSLRAQGKATENDLKELQSYNQRQSLMRKKSRHASKADNREN